MKYIIMVFALAISITKPVDAAFYTGNQLLKLCTADKTQSTYYQENAHCAGYIVGVVDSNELHRMLKDKIVCIPADVTIKQLKDTVIGYLTANPATRHMDASLLVTAAVNDAFNCKPNL